MTLPLLSSTEDRYPWQSKKNWVRSGLVMLHARDSSVCWPQTTSRCRNRCTPAGDLHSLAAGFQENVCVVPSPSVSLTVVGLGLGWKSSGMPNRMTDDACNDQPYPATVPEVSCEL